jgi:hypothetical protein
MNLIQAAALFASGLGAVLYFLALITTIDRARYAGSYAGFVTVIGLVVIGMLGSCLGFISILLNPPVAG